MSTPFSGQRRFNVSDIGKKITGVNYLSKFHFEIDLNKGDVNWRNTLDLADGNDLENKLKDIFIYSENITIPSRGLNTEAYVFSNGFRFEVPTGTNYGDGNISVNIRVDEKYELYNFFINWMNLIHSKETGFFAFQNTYVTDIRIRQIHDSQPASQYNNFIENVSFNSDSKKGFVYGVDLINCYPKSVGAIQFRHDAKDFVKFNVDFSYEKINYIMPELNALSIEQSEESLQNLINAAQGQ